MSVFKQSLKSLGRIKSQSTNSIVFELEDNNYKIVDVESTCDCVASKPIGKLIMVSYTPSKMSKHLKELGLKSQHVVKTITVKLVSLNDEHQSLTELLKIKAEIYD